jgi:hypothetical protein
MLKKTKLMSVQEYANIFKREWCEAKRSKNSTEPVTRQAILARLLRKADLPMVVKREKVGRSWVLTVEINQTITKQN